MQESTSLQRLRPVTMAVAVLSIFVATACDTLTLGGEPESVRLRIESPDVNEITLVTSRWFLRIPDPECPQQCVPLIETVEADTTTVSLPYTQRYPLDFRLQFYTLAYPVVPQTATLSMLVHVDDEEWYNDSRTLQPIGTEGDQEKLEFVYEFNRLGPPS